MRAFIRLVPALVVTLSFAQVPMDKLAGKWKLNISKSKLTRELASQEMKIEKVSSNAMKVVVDSVTTTGDKRQLSYTRVCDGQEHHPDGLAQAIVETCDPTTFTTISKRDGKLSAELRITLAPDGKTHTVTRRRANEEGVFFEEETLVYDRQ